MKAMILFFTIWIVGCASTPNKGHPSCSEKMNLCWYDFRDPITDKFCTTKRVDRVDEKEIRMEFFCQ